MKVKAQHEITAIHVIAVFLIGPYWYCPDPVNVAKAVVDQALSKHRSPGGQFVILQSSLRVYPSAAQPAFSSLKFLT